MLSLWVGIMRGDSMYCERCESDNDANATVCSSCGFDLLVKPPFFQGIVPMLFIISLYLFSFSQPVTYQQTSIGEGRYLMGYEAALKYNPVTLLINVIKDTDSSIEHLGSNIEHLTMSLAPWLATVMLFVSSVNIIFIAAVMAHFKKNIRLSKNLSLATFVMMLPWFFIGDAGAEIGYYLWASSGFLLMVFTANHFYSVKSAIFG